MPLVEVDTPASLQDPTLRRKLVDAGIRAPSGDNCQPWRFRFAGDRLEIELLLDRAESFFDFRHRGSLLSLGAVVENLRVQAACEGLSTNVSFSTRDAPPATPVAIATFEARPTINPRAEENLAAVFDRTVNRRPFLPLRIAADKKRAWVGEAMEGTAVSVIENRREVARWARVTYLGDRIRWTHPTIHRELFASIRFSRHEALSARTGLEIDRLGAGPLAVPIMRWLQPWRRMERLCRFGVDGALANQTRALAFCAGALVLVTIDQDEPAQWLRAGEQVQRLWITAHRQGLCVQPLPVALYLDQRFRAEGMKNFLPRHQTLLETMHRSVVDLLGDRVGAMLYRVGYGWRMRRPAVRLAAESFYDAAEQ